MSEDEILVTVAATLLGIGGWLWRAVRLARARRLHPGPGLSILAATVPACAILILCVLVWGASWDVREAPEYLFMYVMLGIAWLWAAGGLFAAFGISARDDVVERRNGAAAVAVAGGLAGVTLCYAGGNVGDGPGWWVVVFAAGLATLALGVAWGIHELLTGISEVITIDRDPAAGFRLAAFLVACGVLFGRGVAGDWISLRLTLVDFARVLPPAVLLIVAAWLVERATRPTPHRPRSPIVTHGLAPALLFIALAVGSLVFVEPPS